MRVSIRDLLLITVIAALGLAWWRDHAKQVQRFDAVQDEIDKINAQKILLEKGYLQLRKAYQSEMTHRRSDDDE